MSGNGNADDPGDGDTKELTSEQYIDTDDKFVRFLVANLANDGIHVWWLLGVLLLITFSSVLFAFYAATVDANVLYAPQEQQVLTDQAVRRLDEYDRLVNTYGLDYPTIERLAILALSRRALGRPALGI